MSAVSFRNVTKHFARHVGQQLLRHRLRHLLTWRKAARFYALKNVSFDLSTGEGLAVIGSNGAGKSTLLALTAGMAKPSSGVVAVNGRIAALLELGSGFHPDLTGAENVFLNASLLGFHEKQVREMFDTIVDFSGIGDFINEPLRTYSSGMSVRLAFSVAVNVDPDILIADEVLGVGDAAFQVKCFDRVRALRRAGKTFICVSHNKETLSDICDTGLWLEHGEVMMHGPLEDVFEAYIGHRARSGIALGG